MRRLTTPLITLAGTALIGPVAHAHDGHGLFGAHWHATDAWGFVALIGAAAMALWLTRK
jgi:hypothetical protein